ncbi:MAG: hypothetical protein NTV49_08760 [Kiritimatiellaeota bacterium]|nr:hypothetical protein [Kiritimatiellota bacterium]
MKIKKSRINMAALLTAGLITCALALFAGPARANVINIDFNDSSNLHNYSGTGPSTNTGTYWNGVKDDVDAPLAGIALLDSLGAATSVTLDTVNLFGHINYDAGIQSQDPLTGINLSANDLLADNVVGISGDWQQGVDFATFKNLPVGEAYTLTLIGGGHQNAQNGLWKVNGVRYEAWNSGIDYWSLGKNFQVATGIVDGTGSLKIQVYKSNDNESRLAPSPSRPPSASWGLF